MRTQHVESFTVVGFKTRTQNQDERTPATAKIGPLWQRFFSLDFSFPPMGSR